MNFRRIVDDADGEGAWRVERKIIAIDVGNMHQRGEVDEQGFFEVPVRRGAVVGRVIRMVDLVEQFEIVGAIGMDREAEDFVESALPSVAADDSAIACDRRVDGAVLQLVARGLHNSAGTVDNRCIGNARIDRERQRRVAAAHEIGQRIGARAVEMLGGDVQILGRILVKPVGRCAIAVRQGNVVRIFLPAAGDPVQLVQQFLNGRPLAGESAELFFFGNTADVSTCDLERNTVRLDIRPEQIIDDEVWQFFLPKKIQRSGQRKRIDADAGEVRARCLCVAIAVARRRQHRLIFGNRKRRCEFRTC
ncbi:hypothetical protein CSIRO_2966 [Bradyrhizobiaceae bacterium SG-6C]|nr:hypothetical protein CSIRO_2966 [Bradyrhizobiaceae bacterium SG-6C]